MNIKRMIALLLVLCMAFSLCACGGKTEVEETEPDVQEPVVDEPAAPQDEPVEEEPAPAGITYTVKVVDEGGNPVVGAMVQLCQGELCQMPVATDDSGVAVISVFAEGEYEAKLMTMPEGYDYSSDEHVFHFGSSFELTITLKAVA